MAKKTWLYLHPTHRRLWRRKTTFLRIHEDRIMCEPMTIMTLASLAMSAKANDNQVKAQDQAFEANQAAAHAAKLAEDTAAQEDQAVRDTAAANEIVDRNLEGKKQMATASVSAAESGVSGNSVDALMNTLQAGVLKGNTITTQNLELGQRGTNRQLASNSRSASSRINSVARGNRSAANIKIAQSGLAAYNSYQSGKKDT